MELKQKIVNYSLFWKIKNKFVWFYSYIQLCKLQMYIEGFVAM